LHNIKEFFAYGEKVAGYDVRVLNEREARAGAGILFVGAFIGLTNGVMLSTAIFSEYFITIFTFDFIIRVINPRYSPSLLLGRFFIKDQIPEYVGAEQKRFAWSIGLALALPMFYYLVIDFQPNPIKVLICVLCMTLLFLESAFSICLGCKIFNLIKKEKATNCPGGVCEIKIKEPIQTFTPIQKAILIITSILIVYGLYSYVTKLEHRTFFMKNVEKAMMSDEELKKLEDAAYQKELEEFENDDDF